MPVQAQEFVPDLPLSTLREHPDNPRHGSDVHVGNSIAALGFYGAVVVQRSTMYLLAGHTRRRALLNEGRDVVPAFLLDVDDTVARQILLGDNRTAELAVWDAAKLLDVLQTMGPDEYAAAGFTPFDVEAFQRQFETPEPSLSDERELTTEHTCPSCGHVWRE